MSGFSEPNAVIRREYFAGEAGGAATTDYGKFRSFQKMKLKNVHAVVTVAGTVVGHKLDVYKGTTSIGTLALGTGAIGTAFKADSVGAGMDVEFAALDQLSVKSGADITGKAHVIYEYEVLHDAVRTK